MTTMMILSEIFRIAFAITLCVFCVYSLYLDGERKDR